MGGVVAGSDVLGGVLAASDPLSLLPASDSL